MQQTVKSLLKNKGNDVWSVLPSASVFEAIQLMSEKSIGAVLVMEDDKLLGILSERDYARKVILKNHSSKDTLVREIMTSPVLCVNPAGTADECMALMTEKHIRHLPVVENKRVIGVISIGDVVKSVIEAKGILIDQLERYITGH